ncbi:MAG: glutamate racemase [Solirubrobacterales bacterium]
MNQVKQTSAGRGTGRPIGLIDSGVGGLTVLHECLISLPGEDFLYLGDSGQFPYGTKSREELRQRTAEVTRYMLDRGVSLLVVACNSATAAAADSITELAAGEGVDTVTVIGPEAEIAASISDSGRIGVLATPATVSSGAYRKALEGLGRPLEVTEVEAPDLASIIQRGQPFDDEVLDTVRGYCRPLREARVDTLILGCTHDPLVAPMLQRLLGRDVRLVSAGHAIAAVVQRTLAGSGNLAPGDREGGYHFLVTGEVDSFVELGTRFLQLPLVGRVERVDVP